MPKDGARRKLSAIFIADAKGYSRLMGEDDVSTVRTLKQYREVMTTLIPEYRGRVVDSPGDNLLAEFSSVVDAVECAVEIQKELKKRNQALTENRRMEFRIGVTLGEVIEDDERIYGDGINIAARLEGLAEGGGICISGAAFEQIENKLNLNHEYLGEQRVKNIKNKIRVYRIEIEGKSAAPEPEKTPEDSEKPSIAVLPFQNLSRDPDQDYFSDGITEDLITDLSKISALFVIARQSVFTYKNKAVKVEEVGRELGVKYVLEGSIRKSEDRIRITAQLVDATTGGHIWAERYDRELLDIFALQDEVTQQIVEALEIELTDREQENLDKIPTDNLEAYDYCLKGQAYLSRTTKEANEQAKEMFEKAIDLDPNYADAYGALGLTYWLDWTLQWSQDPETLDKSSKLLEKSLKIDDASARAHGTRGFIFFLNGEHDRALSEVEKAIAIAPNDADLYLHQAFILNFGGRADEAVPLIKKAMRLNPHYHFTYLFRLGQAYHFMGRNEEAVKEYKGVLLQNPDFLPAHIQLAVLYTEMGMEKEAAEEVTEILRVSPGFSLEGLRKRFLFSNEEIVTRMFNALRKAGLK
ncbi:MAG: adenylate/guanylate cyclase domain-containing protein [Deltaproteobacteria bacterium]|nr:adenylate/guanylate cyclase domain-containing protein [Deltaproteobacteria bacterium]